MRWPVFLHGVSCWLGGLAGGEILDEMAPSSAAAWGLGRNGIVIEATYMAAMLTLTLWLTRRRPAPRRWYLSLLIGMFYPIGIYAFCRLLTLAHLDGYPTFGLLGRVLEAGYAVGLAFVASRAVKL